MPRLLVARLLLPAGAWALSCSGGCATAGASTAASALSDAGATALAEGALDEAEARLRLALEYQPTLAEAHVNLGLVALARGDLEGAEASLRVALRLDEDSEEAWQSLGVVRLGRGDERLLPAARRRASRAVPCPVELCHRQSEGRRVVALDARRPRLAGRRGAERPDGSPQPGVVGRRARLA